MADSFLSFSAKDTNMCYCLPGKLLATDRPSPPNTGRLYNVSSPEFSQSEPLKIETGTSPPRLKCITSKWTCQSYRFQLLIMHWSPLLTCPGCLVLDARTRNEISPNENETLTWQSVVGRRRATPLLLLCLYIHTGHRTCRTSTIIQGDD